MMHENIEKQRTILHEISNKLTIAEGTLSYFLKNNQSNDFKEIQTSHKYLKETISCVKELRSVVAQIESLNKE